jgi:hypothetical protein
MSSGSSSCAQLCETPANQGDCGRALADGATDALQGARPDVSPESWANIPVSTTNTPGGGLASGEQALASTIDAGGALSAHDFDIGLENRSLLTRCARLCWRSSAPAQLTETASVTVRAIVTPLTTARITMLWLSLPY